MSSKPKTWLKQAKQKRKKEQSLDSADDYQAAGVDFEDAAGKWRAGDPVKSMRFFSRALEVYEQGLGRFPDSFDLAYNKARVLLEVATDPRLINHLDRPVLAVLEAALDSHRYAVDLTQDNPDVYFNTAQVLTSLAEEYAKSDRHDDALALRYLEEALQFLDRCLSIQEFKFNEALELERDRSQAIGSNTSNHVEEDADDEDGGVPLQADAEQEEQWFSIVDPITRDTLVDTVLAQLATLTTLCGVLSNSPEAAPEAMLVWVEEYSSKILERQLPLYILEDKSRLKEIALSKANFVSALLEAGFRSGRMNVLTYQQERDAVFSIPEVDLSHSTEALLANARSLMSFCVALADGNYDNITEANTIQWSSLVAANTNLVAASKCSDATAEDIANSHLLRGDCSMLQYQMSLPPRSYVSAISNSVQLLKNAEVFYRNASKLTTQSDTQAAGAIRSAVAYQILNNDQSAMISATSGKSAEWLANQIDDMISEGLLDSGFAI